MKLLLRQWFLFVLIIIFIVPQSSYAQDDAEQPLLQMLALVPDSEIVRGNEDDSSWLTFINYRAAFEADPVWPRPTDYADYMTQVQQGREEIRLRSEAQVVDPTLPILGVGIGPERDPITLGLAGPRVGEVMPEKLGMDYFDIYYGMQFSRAPTVGLIFGGTFDLEAIGSAHVARGYTEQEIEGIRVWCSGRPDVGCTNPDVADRQGVETYNLFDSRFGRQFPFLGVDRLIAGASDYDLLLAMVNTASGNQESLAEAADFRTLAEALIDPTRYTSELMQAVFFQSASVVETLDLNDYPSAEMFTNQWGSIPLEWQTYGPLPDFRMMAMGDRQEGENRVTLIAVLYDNESDAEAALPELTTRLTTYAGTLEFQQYEPLIGADRLQSSYIYTSPTTGWSAAVVAFSTSPTQSAENEEDAYNILGLCMQGIMSGMFYPLWQITPADWLEASAD